MKTILYLTLGALLACPILVNAQTSTNAAPPGPPPGGGGGDWGHHMKFLTDAEKAELKTANDKVAASDPNLLSQIKSVTGQIRDAHDSGTEPSDDLKAQAKSLHEQLDKELVQADPVVTPILAKI